MNPKLIFFPIIMLLFIGCDSSNSSTNSSDCLFLNESLGCDGNCSTTPLEDDACGVCGGENTILSECDLPHCESDVCISIQNVDLINNILEVWMLNNIPVAGYQFNISGITNVNISSKMRVYPNPSNNRIYILGANGDLSIHNLIGQEVFSDYINTTISIDISSWKAGVYFVKTNNKTVKIIKQ